jgi:hypothetical protein
MASITQILGTDSLSSSRIILNDNFSALNTELSQISTLLNTTAQTLSLSGNVRAGSLTVNNGSINTLLVSASDATFNVETSFDAHVNLQKGVVYSVAGGVTPVSSLPTDGGWEHSTYVMDSTLFTAPVALATAREGQEITLIPSGGSIDFDFSNIAGESVNITLAENKTMTLRYIGSFWYVISKN